MATTRRKKIDFKRIGMKVAGVGAGAIGATYLDGFLTTMSPMVRSGIKIGAGVALDVFMGKNEFLQNVGSGMIAQGAAGFFTPSTPAVPSLGFIAGDWIPETISGEPVINGSVSVDETY